LALIIGSFTIFKGKNVQQYQVVLTVNPDSSFDAETFSYYTDSLIQVINKHEYVLEERYNAILEEKQDAQRYWSIAGVVASIIIAVFGVFGYKSFKDIENKCEDLVRTETAKILNDKLQGLVHSELSQTSYSQQLEKRVAENIQNTILRNVLERLSSLENTRNSNDEGLERDSSIHNESLEMPQLPNSNNMEENV
jgi:hypothetical protein